MDNCSVVHFALQCRHERDKAPNQYQVQSYSREACGNAGSEIRCQQVGDFRACDSMLGATTRRADRARRRMSQARDLTGMQFGYWQVEGRAGADAKGNALWLCRCVCGVTKLVRGQRLAAGLSKSCGCQGRSAICTVDGCDRPAHGHGLCSLHYTRQRMHGDPEYTPPHYTACTVEGCTRPPRSETSPYCEVHYYRLRRGGSVETLLDTSVHEYCLHCGKPLEPGQTKTCSDRCHARYYRGNPTEVACKQCGRMFEPVNGNETCSEECRQKRDRAIGRAYHAKRMKEDPVYRAKMVSAYVARRQKRKASPDRFVVYDHIYERDNFTCRLCGKPIDMTQKWPHPSSPSIDHIVPLSLGGDHTYENCQAAHLHCNLKKQNKVIARGE